MLMFVHSRRWPDRLTGSRTFQADGHTYAGNRAQRANWGQLEEEVSQSRAAYHARTSFLYASPFIVIPCPDSDTRRHTVLYQDHPSNWPLYTPRDKVANMLENYASSQDLVVWTNSKPATKPVYSLSEKRWTVTVDHDGNTVELHPVHIVLATGMLGGPYIPTIAGRDSFEGIAIHSTQYDDPKVYTGKDVVILGAGNTSIDICQDLATSGARSVTMVQRSSTCVVDRDTVRKELGQVWTPGVPVEVGDFKAASVPLGFIKKITTSHQEESWAVHKELHEKLKKGGLKLNIGPEGEGQFLLVFERGGGYCMWHTPLHAVKADILPGLDKGGADLIASGDIKIKQGVSPAAFTKTSLQFSDGTELPADVVIYA